VAFVIAHKLELKFQNQKRKVPRVPMSPPSPLSARRNRRASTGREPGSALQPMNLFFHVFLLLVIGCDGVIGSARRLDRCGVCGGDNSTCQIISGLFTDRQLTNGYNLVARLPKGACHLNVTQLQPSRNYFALRRADGSYVLNGNWAIQWSGEYSAGGSSFTYRRQDAASAELVTSAGPLQEPIDLMVVTQQVNPGIKYEYMLPVGVANNLIPHSAFQHDVPSGGSPPPPPVPVKADDYPNPVPSSGLGAKGGLFLAGIKNSGIQNPEFKIAATPAARPAGSAAGINSGGLVPSSLSSSGSLANLGIQLSSNVPPMDTPLLPATESSPAAASSPTAKSASRKRHPRRRNSARRRHPTTSASIDGDGDDASVTESVSLAKDKSGHPPFDVQATDANVEASVAPRRRQHQRHRHSKTFSWKQVGFSECSKTCGGGMQQSLIVCVRDSNEVPVGDHRCNAEGRLPSESRRCNTKPCPAQWIFTEWSGCSVTCGPDGVQTRELQCRQEISATLTMRVNDGACLSPAPLALPKIRSCNQTPCTHWTTSEWSKCTSQCGKGMQQRRVVCQGADGRDVSDAACSSLPRPDASIVCDMGSCSQNTWFFTEWTGQCSEECGTGSQTRKVHCSGSADDACDAALKPETSRTCVSTKDCSGKWFTGPWSQCTATCGEGTETREVMCLTFLRGQYRVGLDIQCSVRDKPESSRTCNQGKCLSQWYITDWSECSASCGTGAQRREVKCLNSEQTAAHDCRPEERPVIRHACNDRACNEVADESEREVQDTAKEPESTHHDTANSSNHIQDDSSSSGDDGAKLTEHSSDDKCVDKFKNCHLVLQARLCKLKYYLVSCCASCSKSKT